MKRRVLIKIGGKAFEGHDGLSQLAKAIKKIPNVEFIIVHGGGAEISQALKSANRGTKFIDGIRVTDAKDIRIVEDVLSGTVNERIAMALNENGIPTSRISGKTDRLLEIEPLRRNGHEYGFVGHVKKVNPESILQMLRSGQVPVVSPISADESGQSYNVNADNAAAALAVGADCTDLVYFSNVPGVQVNGKMQQVLDVESVKEFITKGIIHGGMTAKMESIFTALDKGVNRVYITQWQDEATLSELIENKSINGTTIKL